MEHPIDRIRLEGRWEEQRWFTDTKKSCRLNFNGKCYAFHSQSLGLRIHPSTSALSYNGNTIHAINEIEGKLVDLDGTEVMELPNRWKLFGQEICFADGLVVRTPTLSVLRGTFDCDECSGDVSFNTCDYIRGTYKDSKYVTSDAMLLRCFQLLWVTTLYGWAAG